MKIQKFNPLKPLGDAGDPGVLNRQITLHYISNTLQCISGLCDTDPQKAKEAISAFAGYLRDNLENMTGEPLIPFERELTYVKDFLELERLTLGIPIEVEFKISTKDFMIAPLALQPVVENAVRYGCPDDDGVVRISVSAFEQEPYICIVVENRIADAARSPQQKGVAHGKSVGLSNVRARLSKNGGGTVNTEIKGNRAVTTMRLLKSRGGTPVKSLARAIRRVAKKIAQI